MSKKTSMVVVLSFISSITVLSFQNCSSKKFTVDDSVSSLTNPTQSAFPAYRYYAVNSGSSSAAYVQLANSNNIVDNQALSVKVKPIQVRLSNRYNGKLTQKFFVNETIYGIVVGLPEDNILGCVEIVGTNDNFCDDIKNFSAMSENKEWKYQKNQWRGSLKITPDFAGKKFRGFWYDGNDDRLSTPFEFEVASERQSNTGAQRLNPAIEIISEGPECQFSLNKLQQEFNTVPLFTTFFSDSRNRIYRPDAMGTMKLPFNTDPYEIALSNKNSNNLTDIVLFAKCKSGNLNVWKANDIASVRIYSQIQQRDMLQGVATKSILFSSNAGVPVDQVVKGDIIKGQVRGYAENNMYGCIEILGENRCTTLAKFDKLPNNDWKFENGIWAATINTSSWPVNTYKVYARNEEGNTISTQITIKSSAAVFGPCQLLECEPRPVTYYWAFKNCNIAGCFMTEIGGTYDYIPKPAAACGVSNVGTVSSMPYGSRVINVACVKSDMSFDRFVSLVDQRTAAPTFSCSSEGSPAGEVSCGKPLRCHVESSDQRLSACDATSCYPLDGRPGWGKSMDNSYNFLWVNDNGNIADAPQSWYIKSSTNEVSATVNINVKACKTSAEPTAPRPVITKPSFSCSQSEYYCGQTVECTAQTEDTQLMGCDPNGCHNLDGREGWTKISNGHYVFSWVNSNPGADAPQLWHAQNSKGEVSAAQSVVIKSCTQPQGNVCDNGNCGP